MNKLEKILQFIEENNLSTQELIDLIDNLYNKLMEDELT